MTTCRFCGEEIIETTAKRSCRNGCDIYTAIPVGEFYKVQPRIEVGSDGILRDLNGGPGYRRSTHIKE
jgi:hypothetical protein